MRKITYLVTGVAMLVLASCDPSLPPNPNEQEVITKVNFYCTSATDTITFGFSDPDGIGGLAPMIDTAKFFPSNTYSVTLELLDETKIPTDTITYEILAEAEAHQFFFLVAGGNLTPTYNDLDSNGFPIGLNNTFATGTISTGTLTLILRHEPDKSAANVSAGDITNAGGETDVEIVFPLIIQ